MANQLENVAKKVVKPLIAQIVPYKVPPPASEPPPFQYRSHEFNGLGDLGRLLMSLGANKPVGPSPNPTRHAVLEIGGAEIPIKTVRNITGSSTSTTSLISFPKIDWSLRPRTRTQEQHSNSTIPEESLYEMYLPLGITSLIGPFILAVGIGLFTSRFNARLGWKEYTALWILLCVTGLGFPDDDLEFDSRGIGIWSWSVVATMAVVAIEMAGKRTWPWLRKEVERGVEEMLWLGSATGAFLFYLVEW